VVNAIPRTNYVMNHMISTHLHCWICKIQKSRRIWHLLSTPKSSKAYSFRRVSPPDPRSVAPPMDLPVLPQTIVHWGSSGLAWYVLPTG